MKILTKVWRRRNKRTGKIEYIGSYNYYTSRGTDKEQALITKSTFKNFKDGIDKVINQAYFNKGDKDLHKNQNL